MGFEKGHTPWNKNSNLIFNEKTFLYKEIEYSVKEVEELYLIKNVQKTDLSKQLNLPIYVLNKIFEYYSLWKPKKLSNKNAVMNTNYTKSVRKIKETKRQKYGNENYNNREKAKETCFEKYGVDNIYKSDIFKENMIKLNQEKYGYNYNSQAQEVKDKKRKTCQNKFGVNCPFQAEEVKEKIKETNLNNLGVEYPTQSDIVMNKQKLTNLERYNREYGFDYEKSKQYFLDKYGVEYYTQTLEYHQKAKKKHYVYDNESFDSFPELALWIYAKDHNEEIERCLEKFTYEYEGREHYYIPDFKYNNKLIEVKGDHFFKDNRMINPFDYNQNELYEAKHQCGLKNNVEFWKYDDYKFAIDYFNTKNYRRSDYEN